MRGFLAGTVKKKLGFSLTSSKPDGAFAAIASKHGALAEMDKPAINIAEALARLSALTGLERPCDRSGENLGHFRLWLAPMRSLER